MVKATKFQPIRPSHRGMLHEKLNVPIGEKIPEAKLERALKSHDAATRKQANFAKVVKGWKK